MVFLRLGLNGGAVGAVARANEGAITRAATEPVVHDVINVIDDDVILLCAISLHHPLLYDSVPSTSIK